MTPKIDKIAAEIQKTRTRIAQDETRVKELEEQKMSLENDEIIARVRASDVPLARIGELLRAYRETGAPPRGGYPPHSLPPDAAAQEGDDE